MKSQQPFVLLSLSVCALALLLTGCSQQAENHTPPTPQAFVQKIENNPHMSAEEKEAAKQQILQHQDAVQKRSQTKGAAGKPNG